MTLEERVRRILSFHADADAVPDLVKLIREREDAARNIPLDLAILISHLDQEIVRLGGRMEDIKRVINKGQPK